MVLMGYHYEIQLHIFDVLSIVNEKPSASNKTKKLVSRSKFWDFEHFQNIVFQKLFLVAGFKFIFTRSVVIGYICQDFLLK